ncbi:MAG: hypothetical protein HY319_03325 [Armatimonadetes bacterium]|nr:hypothetical protein [Armatimonadota bacterium]
MSARPLGWNPELFVSPLWTALRALDLQGPAAVNGEAALAGFWFHHRMVDTLELVTPEQSGLEALACQVRGLDCGLVQEQALPGFLRFRAGKARLDLALELGPPLDAERPCEDGIPTESLRDLAADRWLRMLGRPDLKLLVDLYFLARARVDLVEAARDASLKDIGANRAALAVVLYEMKLGELPSWSVRPVTASQLSEFAEQLKDRLALQTFS